MEKKSSKDILTIHNDVNRLIFNQFTAADYNVFFVLCLRLQGKGQQSVTVYYDDLKKAANLRNVTGDELTQALYKIAEKLRDLDYTVWAKDKKQRDTFKLFTLFPEFDAAYDQDDRGRLIVSVSEGGARLINDLTGNFTSIELQTFCRLKSKYAKTLYRLLKQFDDTGELTIPADRFRSVLGIPDGYKNKDIIDKVIKPTVEALEPYFPKLRYEAIRSDRQGRPVVRYIFYFTKLEEQMTLDQWSEEKKKMTKNKASKKNTFTNFEQSGVNYGELEEEFIEK